MGRSLKIILFLLVACLVASLSAARDRSGTKNVNDYGGFLSAVTAIGANYQSLIVTSPQTIPSGVSVTVGPNAELIFPRGSGVTPAQITVNSGACLYVYAPIRAGDFRIFVGSGHSKFESGASNPFFNSAWVGGDSRYKSALITEEVVSEDASGLSVYTANKSVAAVIVGNTGKVSLGNRTFVVDLSSVTSTVETIVQGLLTATAGVSATGVTFYGKTHIETTGASFYGVDGNTGIDMDKDGGVSIAGKRWADVKDSEWVLVSAQNVSAVGGVTFTSLNPLYYYCLKYNADTSLDTSIVVRFGSDGTNSDGNANNYRYAVDATGLSEDVAVDTVYTASSSHIRVIDSGAILCTDLVMGSVEFVEASGATTAVLVTSEGFSFSGSTSYCRFESGGFWTSTGTMNTVCLEVGSGGPTLTGRFELYRSANWSY